MRVKVRTTRAMYKDGRDMCLGAIFETSLKRAKELRKAGVVKIMERIPEPDRLPEIIKLREQGLTYQTIGEKLNLSKVAVYKRLKKEGLAGRGSLVNQVRDLQERVNELEKDLEEIKAVVIKQL
jgi:DNA-directed RNA polymerase specialized sigma24 family protein